MNDVIASDVAENATQQAGHTITVLDSEGHPVEIKTEVIEAVQDREFSDEPAGN